MKFSIITVTYNSGILLESTINSLINQTYENIEYIVIDGLSTDNTLEIIDSNRSIISTCISEKDAGIYDAMNKGMKLVTGDWCLFLNAGDQFYSSTVLEEVAQKINKDPSFKVMIGSTEILNEYGCPITVLKPLKFNKSNLNMFATRTVCHQSIFVKTDVMPMYDLKFRLKAELDWYYHISQCTSSDAVSIIDVVITKYMLGGEGDTHFFENLKERVSVLRKNTSILEYFFSLPFLLIPLLFRVRRKIFGR